MSHTSSPPAPAILGHCKDVYAKMLSVAQEDREGNKYFEGALTRLVSDCGLSNPYYTAVTQALKAMDCIRMGRRGGGGIGSIWYLLQEPTEALYSALAPNQRSKTGSERKQHDAANEAAIRALHERVNNLEQKVEVLEARTA